jgi:uncharacterized protein YkwD
MKQSPITRRTFLAAATSSALWPICRTSYATRVEVSKLERIFDDLRANLLELVNEERMVDRLAVLKMDDFATGVATTHAEDMATGAFASHWGRNGLKPYQRYSFAGGYHAIEENVSAADNTWSMKPEDLKQDTSYLHIRLYQEKPPNDGHRRTILAPQHTHVGFGIAIDKLRLRVVELYVGKYVEFMPLKQTAPPKARISTSGRLLDSRYSLNTIEVFYEPLPTPPAIEWLRQGRSYSLPDESQILRPMLPPPYLYADGQPGTIVVRQSGDFQVPITLFKDSPGVYTIVCWVRTKSNNKAFPATQLCIRAEDVTA